MAGTTTDVRRIGAMTEVLHAIVYFTPEVGQAYRDAGLRGYWMGYFAGRACPLGPASPELVTALFAGFAPGMVRRSLPDAWSFATPERVLQARTDGVEAALRRLLGEPDLDELLELTGALVASVPLPGRPLAAANAALPRPSSPLAALWQDCTVLREHRGDGHLVAVAATGMTWPEAHLLLAGTGRLDRRQQEHRGWDDAAWDGARTRLRDRGWLDDAGAVTGHGQAQVDALEDATDRLAAPAYDGVDLDRLDALLAPFVAKVVAGDGLPFPNAMGLPRPD